jgi:hypothetical protein
MNAFPRTEACGVSLPRMLISTNGLLGLGHCSPAEDELIRARKKSSNARAIFLLKGGGYTALQETR